MTDTTQRRPQQMTLPQWLLLAFLSVLWGASYLFNGLAVREVPLLSIVLVGLPELQDRLSMRHNRSLLSRLHRRLRIDATTAADTAEYVSIRLKKVGCDRDVFTADAIAMLHEAAGGSLRDVDRLATAALRVAAKRKKKLVEREVLAHVIDSDSRDHETEARR